MILRLSKLTDNFQYILLHARKFIYVKTQTNTSYIM